MAENPYGELIKERPDIQVLAGVCTECGVAAPHAPVHLLWHQELDRTLARLFATGDVILAVPMDQYFSLNPRSEGLDR